MSEKIVLKGDDAIALWKEGKDAWNQWVEENPEADVDFSDCKLFTYREHDAPLDFSFFRFPNGRTCFKNARFGDGNVSFYEAVFGDGQIDFSSSIFGDGVVEFCAVDFGNGGISFSGATFGDGIIDFTESVYGSEGISFHNATFGNVRLDFSHVNFSASRLNFRSAVFEKSHLHFYRTTFGSNTDFSGTKFGNSWVNFDKAIFGRNIKFSDAAFGKGITSFRKVRFGDGDVDFSGTTFGDGDVDFSGTTFGDGDVDFSGATFGDVYINFDLTRFQRGDFIFTEVHVGKGSITFRRATFGEGRISFTSSSFLGSIWFTPYYVEECTELDFSCISIDGYFNLGSLKTNCVIDLRDSYLKRPPVLDKVKISHKEEEIKRSAWPFTYSRPTREDASTCYRYLKQQADLADDHDRKLDFFANEMRCSYGYSLTGWRLYLFLLYDRVSDYGRSISIPFMLLVITTLIFGVIYWTFAWSVVGWNPDNIISALVFSAAHALPFYFGSKKASSDTWDTLFSGGAPPDCIHIVTISQGGISGVLLFLIALALRNQFRS